MNAQKFAVATLAGAVVSFIGGYLIYGLALANFMSAHMMAGMMKDPPDFLHLALGQIASGALLTLAIGGWAKTGGAAAGLKIGWQLGLLMILGFDLTMFATSHAMTDFSAVAVDVVAGTILMAAVGAAVGAAIGRRP